MPTPRRPSNTQLLPLRSPLPCADGVRPSGALVPCTRVALGSDCGSSAELIAEWCGVSIGTAEHYNVRRRKAPTPVLRLFNLLRHQKVLPGEDWE